MEINEYTEQERFEILRRNLSIYENSLGRSYTRKYKAESKIKSAKTPKSKKLWEQNLQHSLELIIMEEKQISEIKAALEAMGF